MEGNYGPDQEIASTSFQLSNIPISTLVRHTFKFGKVRKWWEMDS